jgi:hypothetical protein
VQPSEPLPIRRREIFDAPASERVVPVLAPFRCHALGDGVRNLVLVVAAPHEVHELRFRQPDLIEEQRAQARREVIVAEVAAEQRGACFVDRARQEHEARKPRARIARSSPAQADRPHRNSMVAESSEETVRGA